MRRKTKTTRKGQGQELPGPGAPRWIRLSREEGYRKPGGAVTVARPTFWGNPWRAGTHGDRAACARRTPTGSRAGAMSRPEEGPPARSSPVSANCGVATSRAGARWTGPVTRTRC